MTMAVDGTKNTNNYAEFGADNRRESSYMQVDLGDVCDVNSLSLYRYWLLEPLIERLLKEE